MDINEMMKSFGGGGPGESGPSLGPGEMKSMQALMEAMTKGDPEVKKQIEGYWKMLDGMSQDSPEEYKKFIDEQMKEMKEYESQERKQEEDKFSIRSEPYFAFCMKPAKIHA